MVIDDNLFCMISSGILYFHFDACKKSAPSWCQKGTQSEEGGGGQPALAAQLNGQAMMHRSQKTRSTLRSSSERRSHFLYNHMEHFNGLLFEIDYPKTIKTFLAKFLNIFLLNQTFREYGSNTAKIPEKPFEYPL